MVSDIDVKGTNLTFGSDFRAKPQRPLLDTQAWMAPITQDQNLCDEKRMGKERVIGQDIIVCGFTSLVLMTTRRPSNCYSTSKADKPTDVSETTSRQQKAAANVHVTTLHGHRISVAVSLYVSSVCGEVEEAQGGRCEPTSTRYENKMVCLSILKKVLSCLSINDNCMKHPAKGNSGRCRCAERDSFFITKRKMCNSKARLGLTCQVIA